MLCPPLSLKSSPEIVPDDPVDLQIRVTADRRRKMAVVSGSQSKMSCTLRRIFCLLHSSQCQPAYHPFIGKSPDLFQNFLNLSGSDLLAGLVDPDTSVPDKAQKILYFLRIRIFMCPVYKRII